MMRRVAVLALLLACKPAPPTSPVAAAAPVVAARPTPVDWTADSDVDGVPDVRDRCPDVPEDRDEFEDGDGCVDSDNDGDGILDAHEFIDGRWTNCDYAPAERSWIAVIRGRAPDDADVDCRNSPEDLDGVADHDGCPDYVCFDDCFVRLPQRLHFNARGRFAEDTEAQLDGAAAMVQAVPTGRVWVDAHVDEQRDKAAAKRLTQRIADEAIAGLVRHGVARERLEPRGMGDEVPIAHNKTAEGRAANRRVEFAPMDGCRCRGPEDPRPPEQHLCR